MSGHSPVDQQDIRDEHAEEKKQTPNAFSGHSKKRESEVPVDTQNSGVVAPGPGQSPQQVLLASLVGTSIEFFDFYIYATAAVLVFPKLFFPASNPTAAILASLATFGIAFVARPFGAALFGHFGDRVGRKTSLVFALLTMGIFTVLIGVLPVYQQIGLIAPLLLAICRCGQGIGLGGEWGGAVLLAVENAPPNRRTWYGMFPQLGAPLGFLLSGICFLLLSQMLTERQFLLFGWRLPFLFSALLVLLGLYARLTLTETPVFERASERGEQVRVPMLNVIRYHSRILIISTGIGIATFVLFYLVTVFALSWGTAALGFSRSRFLSMQLIAVSFFALTIPLSAMLAERGRRSTMLGVTAAIAIFGLVLAPLFTAGSYGALVAMIAGMCLMGLSWGPLGTLISELFPTSVRYTGSSLALSFAGILGGSVAPYIATSLAKAHGLSWVGYYLSGSALLTIFALLSIPETRNNNLT